MHYNVFHFKTEEIDSLLYPLLQQDGFHGYSLIGTLFSPCWQQYRKLNSHLRCTSINLELGEWFPDLTLRAEVGSQSPSALNLRFQRGWQWREKKKKNSSMVWGTGHMKHTVPLYEKWGEVKAECKHTDSVRGFVSCLTFKCKNTSQIWATKVWLQSYLHGIGPFLFKWISCHHSEENLLHFRSGRHKSGKKGEVRALYPKQASSFIQERIWPPLEYRETECKGYPHLENGL